MRGSKEEERLRSPMFPRVHVNDTEKGGPRAPPRNKMALYEQLSIPSQKLGSANNESSLVSSMSSSHAGTIERSVFNSFCNSPAPTHSENSFTPYSGGVDLRSKMSVEEQKAVNSPYGRSLSSTQPLPTSAKYNSLQSHNSNFKHFSRKKPEDEVGIRALSSDHSGPFQRYSSSGYSKDRKNQPYWNLSISMQYKNISEKQQSEIGITKLRPRESLSNQTEESRKILDARHDTKTLADASVSPSRKVSKRANPSSNQEYSRGTLDSLKRLRFEKGQSDQGFVAIEETQTTVHRDKSFLEYGGGIGKNNASKATNDSFSKSSPKTDKRSHIMTESEGRKRGSLQVVDVQRNDLSETCELNITPDDVKVLGEKQFWKARKAIANQQRMFGVQVFELHRLMKVQKLIAELPNLSLKDNIYLRKALSKSSPVRKVPSVQAKQQPPTAAKSKDGFQKPYPIAESEANKEVAEKSNNESHSQSGGANNTGPSPPWCVPAAAGNHWLVPVMSPSEGLVYKPFSAPCHPNTGGYMPPVYSNCAPPPGRGDFLNAVYGVPASHQQGLGMTYFPPYGMPMMASSISGSAVEQSSCNMSTQMSRTIARRVRNVQASKESEIQGSTGSSLPPRPNGRPLSLFPIEPTISQSSDQNAQSKEQQTHVIKVVPHNGKLGNESAARIFQSITEEKRKQCC